MQNQVNTDCNIHKKKCVKFCTFSTCQQRIICQKCVIKHIKTHPKAFIYDVQNLCTVHALDKVIKLKQILGKNKIYFQSRKVAIYKQFQNILQPLINRVVKFQRQSRQLLQRQIQLTLIDGKKIIQSMSFKKSDTASIKDQPMLMINQTVSQVRMVQIMQQKIKQKMLNLSWYTDASQQMCISSQNQIYSMIKTCVQMLDNFSRIQFNKFQGKQQLLRIPQSNTVVTSSQQNGYYNSYMLARQISIQKQKMQNDLIMARKQINMKDSQVKNLSMQLKQKQMKIQDLLNKLSRKQQQLRSWQQRPIRQQIQKSEANQRQRKKYQQFLVKNYIISTGGKKINLSKKKIQDIYFGFIFQLIPQPIQLSINQHQLTPYQLSLFYNKRTIQILKMSFMPIDLNFLSQSLKNYQCLHTIELNSAYITDQTILKLIDFLPNTLRHLHLIDNLINDQGLQYLFSNVRACKYFQSLYVSYNNLSSKSMISIHQNCQNLKTLHISKNPLKIQNQKSLKMSPLIQQLFIGGTGIINQGFVSITKNFPNIRRLSLVATQISTDIVSQLLLGLDRLQWLDISYCNLTPLDLQKIQKLKIFNKIVQIIALQ